MTGQTDWTRYEACARCEAPAGTPCRALRQWMGNVRITSSTIARPHSGRALLDGAA